MLPKALRSVPRTRPALSRSTHATLAADPTGGAMATAAVVAAAAAFKRAAGPPDVVATWDHFQYDETPYHARPSHHACRLLARRATTGRRAWADGRDGTWTYPPGWGPFEVREALGQRCCRRPAATWRAAGRRNVEAGMTVDGIASPQSVTAPHTPTQMRRLGFVVPRPPPIPLPSMAKLRHDGCINTYVHTHTWDRCLHCLTQAPSAWQGRLGTHAIID